jgi:DNA-binding beta-propeller fold protein YncE
MPKQNNNSWLDRSIGDWLPKITLENILAILIAGIALFSRLYNVGLRVMSHDEVNHVVPSFELYSGLGYVHSPVTHGPFQFHIVALSYFLLGDSDFSSRVPAVVFSTAAVIFTLFAFRRYFGKNGALLAGFLLTISPYMLFYGRYTRNEAFIELFGVVLVYSIIRYLDRGDKSSLFLLVTSLALHFATKETAYIWGAQLLVLLAILLLIQFRRIKWKDQFEFILGIILIGVIIALLGLSVALSLYWSTHTAASDMPITSLTKANQFLGLAPFQLIIFVTFLGALIALVFLVILLKKAIGQEESQAKRVFDMLILSGSLMLPLLAAFPVKMIGWNPLDYTDAGILHTSIILVCMILMSLMIGIIWDFGFWVKSSLLFYGIFIVFYTTFLTNGQGFFTGIIGSLGYWLEQQGVNRGSQPWYYYILVQIPIYEFLPFFGFVISLYYGIRHRLVAQLATVSPAGQIRTPKEILHQKKLSRCICIEPENAMLSESQNRIPVSFVLSFFSITSLMAYSIAGEKMPWLTVHIALPMILAAGWGLGILIDRIEWKKFKNPKLTIGLILMLVFLASLSGVISSIFNYPLPFQGKTVEQLTATSNFLLAFMMTISSGYGAVICFRKVTLNFVFKNVAIVLIAFLLVITIRTSIRANYINYDSALEYLVYAHSARGPKDVLTQVEEISKRTVGGLDIRVAYDNKALYPFWWYFRHFPNKVYFADTPTKDILNSPVILTGEETRSKVETLTKNDYIVYEYQRMVWPNMDYFNLTVGRIWNGIKNPEMWQAIFDIWFNRNYSLYAKLTNSSSLTENTWAPSEKLWMFIRKDVVAEIWNYGTTPAVPLVSEVDPYIIGMVDLQPDRVIGQEGSSEGQFNAPRGMAMGLDGSLYVADSRNNRIQHFSTDGTLLQAWGTFSNILNGEAPPGTFNEPWGIAVGPDGSVYVTDTWNYRIQKFTGDGKFISMWNTYGDPKQTNGFYGPRGIVVNKQGLIYVTDTGNNRVVVFDQDGKYLMQFGDKGFELGQFDEPVGFSFDNKANLYIADAWNQRIQVFVPDATGIGYSAVSGWDVKAWASQSAENKPFLAVNSQNHVFVTDPEGYRVLEFSENGAYLRGWGSYSPENDGFGLPSGIIFDGSNGVWVSDAGNNVLLHFSLPEIIAPPLVNTLPLFPPTNKTLEYNSGTGKLEVEGNLAVYQLDPFREEWVPIIPGEILSQVPEGTSPRKDSTNAWTLFDEEGMPIFRWDYSTMKWLPVE